MPLPDEEGAGLIANILPLQWNSSRNPLGPLPGAAAIFIQDPAENPKAPLDALAELYGLTAAERKVLELVAEGATPQDAADRLSVSLATVKTHLQHVFAKTNTGRQVDLVRLVVQATAPIRPKLAASPRNAARTVPRLAPSARTIPISARLRTTDTEIVL